jgi:hypothetical protein
LPRKKLTEAEKLRRKHQRKADALNAAAEKAHGPLFAHLAPKVDAANAYWKWRRDVARAADDHIGICPAWRGLQRIQLRAIERLARELIGPDADLIAERVRQRGPEFWLGMWRGVLTGAETVVLAYRLEFDPARATEFNRDGRRVIHDRVFPPPGSTPLLTAERFDEMFPRLDARHGPDWVEETDDGGLFERTIGSLKKGA